jgi:hypothetical protein
VATRELLVSVTVVTTVVRAVKPAEEVVGRHSDAAETAEERHGATSPTMPDQVCKDAVDGAGNEVVGAERSW